MKTSDMTQEELERNGRQREPDIADLRKDNAELKDVRRQLTTETTIKCFIAWHDNLRGKLIMGAFFSSLT
jgi:hypothetical protein